MPRRRDYDCAHENRHGVTGSVRSPEGALDLLENALVKMPHISVDAVAGPGDAFCTPEITLQTFELIRKKYSDIALCISTNGLNVKDHILQLCELNVRVVTLTVNAIDPNIGMHLHKWINFGGKITHGVGAAQILMSRKLEATSLLKAAAKGKSPCPADASL